MLEARSDLEALRLADRLPKSLGHKQFPNQSGLSQAWHTLCFYPAKGCVGGVPGRRRLTVAGRRKGRYDAGHTATPLAPESPP